MTRKSVDNVRHKTRAGKVIKVESGATTAHCQYCTGRGRVVRHANYLPCPSYRPCQLVQPSRNKLAWMQRSELGLAISLPTTYLSNLSIIDARMDY